MICEDGEYVEGDECVPCGDTVNDQCPVIDTGENEGEEEEEEEKPIENSAPFFIDYDPYKVYEIEKYTELTVQLPFIQDNDLGDIVTVSVELTEKM